MPRAGTVSPTVTLWQLRYLAAWLRRGYRPTMSQAAATLGGTILDDWKSAQRVRAHAIAGRLLKAARRGDRRRVGWQGKVALPRADAQWLHHAVGREVDGTFGFLHPLRSAANSLDAVMLKRPGRPRSRAPYCANDVRDERWIRRCKRADTALEQFRTRYRTFIESL